MSDWRLIDSAPKDGSAVLGYGQGVPDFPGIWDPKHPREPMCVVINWVEGWYNAYEDNGDGTFREERRQGYAYWGPHPQQFRPTHWMPLPQPPEPSP